MAGFTPFTNNYRAFSGDLSARATVCTNCGKPVGSEKFCSSCGTPTGQNKCTNCGTDLAAGAKFCANCGSAVVTPA
jgi:rRNA maturation endonuclease Nob1